jgi:hypothetical protein
MCAYIKNPYSFPLSTKTLNFVTGSIFERIPVIISKVKPSYFLRFKHEKSHHNTF